MLYLNIMHIDKFAQHLKDNNIREAFVSHGIERLGSSNLNLNQATLTARIGDYISVCEFTFQRESDAAITDKANYLTEQIDMLKERLARFDIQTKEGHWTNETPKSLSNN